jgi:hypothetical protein
LIKKKESRFQSLTSQRFSTPTFFSNDSRPSLFSSYLNFHVNPCPTNVYSTYKPLILDGFLKFWCFSIDLQEWIQKLPLFFSYGCCRFLVRRGVFMLYNFFICI